MADSDNLFLYLVIGFGFGIYLFIKGFSWFRLKRMVENIPTSKIRSLAMGLVEIYGSVVLFEDKVLKSPFTGKDCVYYKYKIEELRRSKNSSYWATIKKGSDMTHFFLKDNTGSVLIDPKDAQIDIPHDYQIKSSTGHNPPAIVTKFLKANKLTHESFFGFNKTMRYTEYYIAPKDKLYILGTAGDNPFVEDTTGKRNEDDIMIQHKGGSLYYISDSPEDKLLGKLKWKVIGGFFGGGALIVGCLAGILLYLGIF